MKRSRFALKDMGKEYLEGKLNVEIPSGSGFPEGADAYVKVYMIKDKLIGKENSCMKKSSKKKNSQEPEWNLSFEKNLKGNYEGFKVRVMDSDLFKDDKFGDVDVDIDRLKSGEEIEGEFPLDGGRGTGSIRMKVKFTEDNVMFEYNSTSDSD